MTKNELIKYMCGIPYMGLNHDSQFGEALRKIGYTYCYGIDKMPYERARFTNGKHTITFDVFGYVIFDNNYEDDLLYIDYSYNPISIIVIKKR